MEPPSKRRRILEASLSAGTLDRIRARHDAISAKVRSAREFSHQSRSAGVRHHQRQALGVTASADVRLPELERHRKQPAVASMIQVAVAGEDGSILTTLLIPAQSSVANIPGIGPVTLNSAPPGPTSQPDSDGSDAPQGEPDAQSPAASSRGGARSNPGSPTSQKTPMSLSPPDARSQVVLSSPQPTPSPSGSNAASSPVTGGSYFSATPGALSAASTSLQPSPSGTQEAESGSGLSTIAIPAGANATSSTSEENTVTPTAMSLADLNAPTTRNTSSANSITSTLNSASDLGPVTSSFTSNPASSSATISGSNNSSTSTTALTSSSASISASASASRSQSSLIATPSSTFSETSGVVGGGGAGGTGAAASPTSNADAGGGSSNVSTPAVVGGVVGGVAGLAVILVLLLFLLRRRRVAQKQQRNISNPLPQDPPGAPMPPPTAGTTTTAGTGTMTQRSSTTPLAASGAFFRRLRSSGTTAGTTETTPSEKGFQNLGGRKIESVLTSGGDGYGQAGPSGQAPRGYSGTQAGLGLGTSSTATGGAPPPSSPGTSLTPAVAAKSASAIQPHRPQEASPGPSDSGLSETSFYRDSQGFYGGAGDEPLATSPGSSPSGPSAFPQPPAPGEVNYRPSPARQPVINQPGLAAALRPPAGRGTPPSRGRGTPPPPRALTPQVRDEIGRSHPSFDGSRGSRFTEEV